MDYNAENPTQKTLTDCEAAVGKRVTLTLTGTITAARVSDAGPFVIFELDERWGFPVKRLGLDLDPFTIENENEN